jgi:hypothetical protein
MAGRWSSTPQPIPLEAITEDGRRFQIFDPMRLTLDSKVDVYPGEREILDIAARMDNEPDCYGWNNEAYLQEQLWRTPRWRLVPGRYLVKIVVASSGQRCTVIFRLINDVPQADFRLEPALPNDRPR